jgi:hypothetical protein
VPDAADERDGRGFRPPSQPAPSQGLRRRSRGRPRWGTRGRGRPPRAGTGRVPPPKRQRQRGG